MSCVLGVWSHRKELHLPRARRIEGRLPGHGGAVTHDRQQDKRVEDRRLHDIDGKPPREVMGPQAPERRRVIDPTRGPLRHHGRVGAGERGRWRVHNLLRQRQIVQHLAPVHRTIAPLPVLLDHVAQELPVRAHVALPLGTGGLAHLVPRRAPMRRLIVRRHRLGRPPEPSQAPRASEQENWATPLWHEGEMSLGKVKPVTDGGFTGRPRLERDGQSAMGRTVALSAALVG